MKRIKFEEILQTEFRWPTDGDAAFVTAEDSHQNANIAEDEFTRLVFMMERDYLVCPIIFNYRQFIELSLKYIIANYGGTVGIDPVWNSHDLPHLWLVFTKVLARYGTTDPDEADPVVAGIVAEFAKIDPGSYSHRYPVDTKGQPIPLTVSDLHLPTLADVMEGIDR